MLLSGRLNPPKQMTIDQPPAVVFLRVCMVAVTAAVVIGHGLQLSPSSPMGQVVFLGGYLLVGVIAAGLFFARGATDVTASRLWQLIGIAVAAWAVGAFLASARYVGLMSFASPSVSDLVRLIGYPFAFFGLASRVRSGPLRRSAWVDALVCGFGALAFESAMTLGWMRSRTDLSMQSMLITVVYGLGDVALVVILVVGLGGWRRSRTWGFMTIGLLLFAMADSLMVVAGPSSPTNDVLSRSVSAVWLIGLCVVGLSSWSGFATSAISDRRESSLLLPFSFAAVAVGLILVDRFQRIDVASVVLATLCIVLAVVRAGMAVRDLRMLSESRKEARTDELTGLPNRRAFTEMIAEAVERSASVSSPLAILMIDLDGFKVVNDTLGHHSGDELLREVARRFATTLAPGDVLARLGGDEFGVVVQPRPAAGWAFEAGARLTKSLSERFELDGLALRVSGSVGISLYPDHADTPSALLQRADVAMYEAKRAGGGVRFYSTNFDRNSREQLEQLEQLRVGIESSQLVLFYQPKVMFSDGSLKGVEALVRWQHPTRGLLTPDQFLPLAVSGGLLPNLTRAVLGLAVAQAGRWQYEGSPISIAVNVGSADLVDPSFPDLVLGLIGSYQLPAELLTIEITEDAVIDDPVLTAAVVARLRHLGVKVAVDDFGAGYASLSHLRELDVDELKIDRSLVDGVEHSTREQALVASAVGLAHALGLVLVAEGVETPEAWDRLREMGCDIAQGYLVSRPLSAGDLREWIVNRNRPVPISGPVFLASEQPVARRDVRHRSRRRDAIIHGSADASLTVPFDRVGKATKAS